MTAQLTNLAFSIVGGLIALLISKIARYYYRRWLKDDIGFLELERRRIEEMQDASVMMSRMGFRSLFSLLFASGVCGLLFLVAKVLLVGYGGWPMWYANSLGLGFLIGFVWATHMMMERFGPPEKTLAMLDRQIEKKRARLNQ